MSSAKNSANAPGHRQERLERIGLIVDFAMLGLLLLHKGVPRRFYHEVRPPLRRAPRNGYMDGERARAFALNPSLGRLYGDSAATYGCSILTCNACKGRSPTRVRSLGSRTISINATERCSRDAPSPRSSPRRIRTDFVHRPRIPRKARRHNPLSYRLHSRRNRWARARVLASARRARSLARPA